MVEILKAFQDPESEKLTIMASTQVGKTLFILVALAYVTSEDPAPSLICLPSQSAATELRDRFYANAIESPMLRDRVPSERKWNTRHIDMKTCRIYLAWAGSRQRLRGRACRYVFLSEIDVYQITIAGNPIRVAEERTKKFYRRKIVQESSPVGEDSLIAAEYDAGDRRKWHAKCPQCGVYQELRFFTYHKGKLAGLGGMAGYRDQQGEVLSVDQARRDAHYRCVSGCEIRDDQKRAMVDSGRWLREGERIDKRGCVGGTPSRSSRHASFHLWSVHSNTISFADIAEAYIRHWEQGQVGDFWQNWIGLKYSTSKRVPRWQRAGNMLAGTHERCTVHHGAWFLTAGCDVQENGVYYVVRGWGHNANSWLVDWGFIARRPDEEREDDLPSDIRRVNESLLTRRWGVVGAEVNPLGKTEVGVRLAGMDSGYRTADVHRLASELDTERFRVIVGDTASVKSADRFRRTRVERAKHKSYERKELWRINVDVYKEDLMQRILSGCDGHAKTFTLTSDVQRFGVEYLKQLVNERKRVEETKYGRSKTVWAVRAHTIGNHYWDCEVYCRAVADMVLHDLGLDWDSDEWPRPNQDRSDEPIELMARSRET